MLKHLRTLQFLATCKNTLKAIGYLSQIENLDVMKKLTYMLQERWRNISLFVDRKGRAMSNPLLGKIGSNSEEKQGQSQKLKSKTTQSFVAKAEGISTESSKRSQHNNGEPLRTVCPVCLGEHRIHNCTQFKEKDRDRKICDCPKFDAMLWASEKRPFKQVVFQEETLFRIRS